MHSVDNNFLFYNIILFSHHQHIYFVFFSVFFKYLVLMLTTMLRVQFKIIAKFVEGRANLHVLDPYKYKCFCKKKKILFFRYDVYLFQ